MRTVQFTRMQKIAFVAAIVLMILSLASGPYFNTIVSSQNHQQLVGIQRLLNFVAKVQANGGAGSTDTTWYVNEIRNICAATPSCRQLPVPPTLQSTTTTAPARR